jgi:putative hemolysin
MLELAIVLVLILLNGLFALSELALVAARRPRLRALAEEGRPGARAALALTDDPARFLSTVQIGITLVGILAGAFSGAALGGYLAAILAGLGLPRGLADPLGFGLVVLAVTYLSIVVGELVPKRLALRNAERVACLVAPVMTVVSRIATPAAWLLDASGDLIFRLFGHSAEEPEERVTEEDVRQLVAEAERSGAIEAVERRMIAGVLRLGERSVRAVMTPRGEVDWIDVTAGVEAAREVALRSPHSRLPVGDGSADAILGVIQSRDLLAALLRGEQPDLRALARQAPAVPDTADALDVLATLREAAVPMALVHDEYGNFEGVVTPTDLTEAIVGAFRADLGAEEPKAVRREDGSWLLAGWMPADEMAERFGLRLPEERPYHTVAGFVLGALGRLPQVGDAAVAQGWRFEVVDMDGRRIDKVLVAPAGALLAPAAPHRAGSGPARA